MSVKSQWPKLPAKFLIQFLMHWAVLQSRKTRHEVVPCCNTGEVVSKLGKPVGRANLVNGWCTLPVAQVRIYVNALSGWLLTCWLFFSLTTFVLTHKFVMYLKCVVSGSICWKFSTNIEQGLSHGQLHTVFLTLIVSRSSWLMVSRQYDAGHPSNDDVTGRQSICRRRTACLEQPTSCHPWSVTVAVNLRKAAENLFVCLRVAVLVTYELAPWKCTN